MKLKHLRLNTLILALAFYGTAQASSVCNSNNNPNTQCFNDNGNNECFVPFPALPDQSIPAPISLQGKVALVTGISRGQGREIGAALKREGVFVIGTSRKAKGFPKKGLFHKPYFIPQVDPRTATAEVPQACDILLTLDLNERESIDQFISCMQKLFTEGELRGRKLDIICQNAANNFRGTLLGSINQGGSALENYTKVYLGTGLNQSLLWAGLFNLLPQEGYSRIVNTSSVVAVSRNITELIVPYVAGKAALRSFGDILRREVAVLASNTGLHNNLFISTVEPYFIATTLAKVSNKPDNEIFCAGALRGDFETPGIQEGSAFFDLIAKFPFATDASQVGEAYVQLLKMDNPFIDIRIQENPFWDPFWKEIWCGSPAQPPTFPPARDCINTTDVYNIYADINPRLASAIPFGTTVIDAPEDWDIVNIKKTPKIALNVGVWPFNLGNDFEVVYFLNGIQQAGTLSFLLNGLQPLKNELKKPVILGNAYVTEVDLSSFNDGDIVTLQAHATKFQNQPIQPNPFNSTFSRIVHLVIHKGGKDCTPKLASCITKKKDGKK